MDSTAIILVVPMLIVVAYVNLKIIPLWYDYKISHEGVDIVVGRTVRVAHLSPQRIVKVMMMTVPQVLLDLPFLGLSLGNRLQWRVLVIRTNGFFGTWYLTPPDPDEALRTLEQARLGALKGSAQSADGTPGKDLHP